MKQSLFIAIGPCLMVMSFLPVEFKDEDGTRWKNQILAKIACFATGAATIAFCLLWFR